MMTAVPSGSAPAATAITGPLWPRSGSPTGAPSASRHTPPAPPARRPPPPPPPPPARPPPPAPARGPPPREPPRQPPPPHGTVAAAADDDRGAIRQPPGRHRGHPAVVAGQRLPGRGAVGGP